MILYQLHRDDRIVFTISWHPLGSRNEILKIDIVKLKIIETIFKYKLIINNA